MTFPDGIDPKTLKRLDCVWLGFWGTMGVVALTIAFVSLVLL